MQHVVGLILVVEVFRVQGFSTLAIILHVTCWAYALVLSSLSSSLTFANLCLFEKLVWPKFPAFGSFSFLYDCVLNVMRTFGRGIADFCSSTTIWQASNVWLSSTRCIGFFIQIILRAVIQFKFGFFNVHFFLIIVWNKFVGIVQEIDLMSSMEFSIINGPWYFWHECIFLCDYVAWLQHVTELHT